MKIIQLGLAQTARENLYAKLTLQRLAVILRHESESGPWLERGPLE